MENFVILRKNPEWVETENKNKGPQIKGGKK